MTDYRNSPRKRLGNWLAGSNHKWVRKLSDLCYTKAEHEALNKTAKNIVDVMVMQDKKVDEILKAHPDIKPLLHTFTLPSGMERYDIYNIEGLIVYDNWIGSEKMAGFLKEFAITKDGYDVCMYFLARLPWWLDQKGYFDMRKGEWTANTDQAALEAATQLIHKDLAERICKTVPGDWEYDTVVKQLALYI